MTFLEILFIFLFEKERQHVRTWGEGLGAQRDKQTFPLRVEPKAGLDPKTLRS